MHQNTECWNNDGVSVVNCYFNTDDFGVHALNIASDNLFWWPVKYKSINHLTWPVGAGDAHAAVRYLIQTRRNSLTVIK